MPYDNEYFKPDSDDFVLFYSPFEDYGDYKFNSDAVLISFDASGNIIGAKYRLFRSSNTTNPMSELVGYKLAFNGTKLLYSDDTYAYFDIFDCDELKEYLGDGKYGDRYKKSEFLNNSIDETNINMPLYGWSSDIGMYMK